ncbi:cytochrome-c peroxidase [Adhaeribacter rhizoryzae]|uniref:Cytochrome-c peroxidase n=1 Tax=Adhaeribacter rhizoryzae TaxID=2607907 RepID=A0A5M6CU91_9BACT|nr:cytochrome c peroxidase [Adhaeribacter rhizoryzae]KAA5538623.1 cytochrome-c peroxidase [Adhaeribacter rhizoryzae]
MSTRLTLLTALLSVFSFWSCQKEESLSAPEPEEPEEAVIYDLTFPKRFGSPTIPANNPLTQAGVDLGRVLFYEKKLSGDNTLSCGSCHQQKLAFTDGKAFGVGVGGKIAKRSTMALANVAYNTSFNWDGAAATLEEQARFPLENPLEMNQNIEEAVRELQSTPAYPPLFQKAFGTSTITADLLFKALSQFQRILISANSPFDQYRDGFKTLPPEEIEGFMLFMTHPDPAQNIRGGNCGDCHGSDLTSLQQFHNNGLDLTFADNGRGAVTGRSTDNGKFKAPSIRNIALTAPYMHDGRFKTLEEVLDHYNEHIQANSPNLDPLIMEASNQTRGKTLALTAEEKAKIIKFLHTLTDEFFIQDKRFSEKLVK